MKFGAYDRSNRDYYFQGLVAGPGASPKPQSFREHAEIHQCRLLIDKKTFVAYTLQMPAIKRTDEFSKWLRDLRDIRARAKVLARLDRLSLGNPGDVAPVGDGITEMRIHYGPGYRVYYVQRGEEIVVLLCGGDKSSQVSDIRAAKKLAVELEN
jgi:putative addiction module killer protein